MLIFASHIFTTSSYRTYLLKSKQHSKWLSVFIQVYFVKTTHALQILITYHFFTLVFELNNTAVPIDLAKYVILPFHLGFMFYYKYEIRTPLHCKSHNWMKEEAASS